MLVQEEISRLAAFLKSLERPRSSDDLSKLKLRWRFHASLAFLRLVTSILGTGNLPVPALPAPALRPGQAGMTENLGCYLSKGSQNERFPQGPPSAADPTELAVQLPPSQPRPG